MSSPNLTSNEFELVRDGQSPYIDMSEKETQHIDSAPNPSSDLDSVEKAVGVAQEDTFTEEKSEPSATQKVNDGLLKTIFCTFSDIFPLFFLAYYGSKMDERPTAQAVFIIAGLWSCFFCISALFLWIRLYTLKKRESGCSEHFANFISSHRYAYRLLASPRACAIHSWGAAALMWSLVLDRPLAAIELSAYMQNQLYFYAGLLSCGTLCYVLMILLNFGRCSDGAGCDNHADGLPTKSLLLHVMEAIVPGHRR